MPRGDCSARGNTVDPATRWRGALVEANARRRLAQRRDWRHRAKQPAGLEEELWISPALAGRDTDVPFEGAHGQEPGGAHDWRPGHRGSHPRGRAQSHDLAGAPSVRPYRVNSWGKGKVPVRLDLCNNAAPSQSILRRNVEESNCVTGFNACFPLDRGRKVTHLPARPRKQLCQLVASERKSVNSQL